MYRYPSERLPGDLRVSQRLCDVHLEIAMKVSEIMTRRVVSVSPQATVVDAAKSMMRRRISGLPVVDANGTLIGIITESDLLRRPETGTADKHRRWYDAFFGPDKSANEYVHSHGSKVHEVMSREAITVDENTDLDHAVHLMEKHRVKRLPVLRSGKLVGIVSRANLVRALVGLHRSTPEASRSDLAIREQILDDIDKESWTAGACVDVVVRKGVVDLWGEVADPPQKEAIRVLAEAVPGVSEVFDHLSLTEQVTVT